MAIYRMPSDKQKLVELSDTSFAEEGIREVEDLQRILQDQPEVIEKDLFIIRSEFSAWQDSGQRIDLLALDTDGRLVVIELKRTRTGDHAELQAIRYAAMVANLTFDRIVKAHQEYLDKGEIQEDAEARICDHLGISDPEDAEVSTETPRIILVSEGFSNELTTSVLWLNDNFGLDIKCIRLKPYRNGEEFLVDSSQMIPLPEAADYRTQFREREREIQRQRSSPSHRVPGGDAFRESIGSAREQIQPALKRLYDWAVALEQEGLVELSTYEGTESGRQVIRFALKVPKQSALVQFYSNGEIRFWPKSFNRLAPDTMRRLDSPKFGLELEIGKTNYRRLNTIGDLEAFLNTLTQAYREANGLLADDEPEPANSENSSAQG